MERTSTQVRFLTTTSLSDEPVKNSQGERIGKVEDYMLDLERGCVAYAVLSFGGVMGMGDKLFAIPWDSMTLDTENHNFVLDVAKERLEDAPGFDKNNWPMTEQNEGAYRSQVDEYWTSRASMGGATGGGSAGGGY